MAMAQKLIELVRSIGNDVKLLTQRVDEAEGGAAGALTEAEAQTGTSAVQRTISAVVLKGAIGYHGLKIGTTATTAKAGNWLPAWGDVGDKPAFIAAGGTQAAARSAIGAGTSSLAIGSTSTTAKAGDWKPAWSDVENKPTVIAAGATAELARQAIGAGTSSLTLGTTSSTAAAGDHTHAGLMTQAERSKLASIQEGATAFALPAGVSGQVLKHNGTEWVAGTDNNTTYSTITNAEATAGTSTASRLVTPARLKLAIEAHAVPTATGQALEQRVSQLEASSSSGGITRARAQAIALCF